MDNTNKKRKIIIIVVIVLVAVTGIIIGVASSHRSKDDTVTTTTEITSVKNDAWEELYDINDDDSTTYKDHELPKVTVDRADS